MLASLVLLILVLASLVLLILVLASLVLLILVLVSLAHFCSADSCVSVPCSADSCVSVPCSFLFCWFLCVCVILCMFIYTGAVLGCCHWSRWDEWRWPCLKYQPGCQLLGFFAQEELAECASPIHQEHNGETAESLLERCHSKRTNVYWICGTKFLWLLIFVSSNFVPDNVLFVRRWLPVNNTPSNSRIFY